MVFASVFMVVLIAALVLMSHATTFGKKIVRELNDDAANQPSQRILNLVAAMSPAERVALSPTMLVAPTNVTHKKSDVQPSRNPVKEPISA
jgi:hypothetical protein